PPEKAPSGAREVLRVHPDEGDATFELLCGGGERRSFLLARHTPGGPEVEHGWVAAQLVEAQPAIVETSAKSDRPSFVVRPNDRQREGRRGGPLAVVDLFQDRKS